MPSPEEKTHFYLQLPVAKGKQDPRSLEEHLPTALRFAAQHIARRRRILVYCDTGTDRAVAVAMAILISFFSTDALVSNGQSHISLDGRGLSPLLDGAHNTNNNPNPSHVEIRHMQSGSEEVWSNQRLESLCDTQDTDVRAVVSLKNVHDTKAVLTQCLHCVALSWPCAAPSRHTLKKLHRFFGEL